MGEQEVGWLKLLDGQRSKEALEGLIPAEYFEKFFLQAARMELLEGSKSKTKFDLFKIKIPLANPNGILDKLGERAVVYRKLLNMTAPAFFALNVAFLILTSNAMGNALSGNFSWWTLAFYPVAVFLMAFAHESSHAVVAKSFGVNVPAVGAMLFYLQPAFYADVTGIRFLKTHAHRINVLLAGIMANNLLISASIPVYIGLQGRGGARYVLYFALMNFIVLLINLIPFVEYDGYYVLLELLNEPDFRINVRKALAGIVPRRFEYMSYLALSNIFAGAIIFSALLELRILVSRFVHTGIINYITLILMLSAYLLFLRRTVR
jgi:putative peptide zinc metalloprotease protein